MNWRDEDRMGELEADVRCAAAIIRDLVVALPSPSAKSGKFFDLRVRAEAWLASNAD